MGLFLSLTSVIGKSETEVAKSLANYAWSVEGGLEKEDLSIDNDNCCVIEEADGNTTIFNPFAFLEWDNSAEFISKELNAPVFSFHIHDGDLWMYILFVNGEAVDHYNPVPDYWDEDVSAEELETWKGNAAVIANHIKYITAADIDKYLVRWDLDAEAPSKAYPTDESPTADEWQLLDFMKKLRLPFPLDDHLNPKASTYKLWTKELALKS